MPGKAGEEERKKQIAHPVANDATGFGMTGCGAGVRRKTAG